MQYKYQNNISKFNKDSFILDTALFVSKMARTTINNYLIEVILKDKSPLNFKKEYSYRKNVIDIRYTEYKAVSWLVKRRNTYK
jgi:hypothetical protein